MSGAPVGIFDSGVGGLTVVREIQRQLPRESVVYFGDTARVPYGSKSPETVIRFSKELASFLLSKGVKMIVAACNTASSVSLPALEEFCPVPVIGVIEPGARAAAASTRNGIVGVIGTLGTISSGAYQNALRGIEGVKAVVAQPCPLLVPLVEEGWLDHEITTRVVEEYMKPLKSEGIDTLVLGCTHYPLLKPVFGRVLGPGVTLVDSAEAAAAAVARRLGEDVEGMPGERAPDYRFYVSDIPLKFQEIAQRFLGRSIPLVTQVELGEAR
ncbi:glutamate racemase [Candidatus Fermentibacteria bacterium]|nr:glutamate racemase [Candidatus Fermentibacteria bacterium]